VPQAEQTELKKGVSPFESVLKGHDLSRAVRCRGMKRALTPQGRFSSNRDTTEKTVHRPQRAREKPEKLTGTRTAPGHTWATSVNNSEFTSGFVGTTVDLSLSLLVTARGGKHT